IALESPGNATKLHVSELTREHLRKTMTFFLALSADQGHVPFPHAGTGTINTLVLALLSFIADLKPETVIFALEGPEIGVPPHRHRCRGRHRTARAARRCSAHGRKRSNLAGAGHRGRCLLRCRWRVEHAQVRQVLQGPRPAHVRLL